MILIKGEKPLDLTELLKDIKTKKIILGMNGYIKIIIQDKQGIKKLKELGFNEIQS